VVGAVSAADRRNKVSDILNKELGRIDGYKEDNAGDSTWYHDFSDGMEAIEAEVRAKL
jgi:hypothetical protein